MEIRNQTGNFSLLNFLKPSLKRMILTTDIVYNIFKEFFFDFHISYIVSRSFLYFQNKQFRMFRQTRLLMGPRDLKMVCVYKFSRLSMRQAQPYVWLSHWATVCTTSVYVFHVLFVLLLRLFWCMFFRILFLTQILCQVQSKHSKLV